MSTLTQLVADHDNLVAEAALALPHSFSNCTYPLGSIRQAVYLCLICASPRGICSACSIACHGDHEQLELFPKRNFRCDCPTNVLAHACTLHKTPQIENEGNTYGQNFRGRFCRCGRPYDPVIERETMIQCLDCEDWYHESCLNLRERPSSREASPALNSPPTNLHNPEEEANDNDNALSETSSSGLPSPLITGSEYDCFVCGSCVSRLPILKRYAGTPGVMMISRDGESEGQWKVIGRIQESSSQIEQDVEVSDPVVGSKRRRSSPVGNADPAPDTKRPRADTTSSTPCLAPVVNPTAEKIFALSATGDFSLGVGDIFLTQGWRERWCRCDTCRTSIELKPFLAEEEETYEPPEDPDSGLSLEELGMRALQNIPRERAIDGIRAFNDMRDGLVQYLRPFAQEGKVVSEADVRAFFEARLEAARTGNL